MKRWCMAKVFISSALGGRKSRKRQKCFLMVAEAAYRVVFARTQTVVGQGVNLRISFVVMPKGKQNPNNKKETISVQ